MESTQADPRIGLVLNGRYRITAPIGEGGMGLVYLGERLQLRRPVAIKFLQTSYADSARFVARFEREARAMSMLSHPYCVSVLDFGVHEAPYIIMDYVTGATLRQVLDEGRLSPQRALSITRQILIALAHAHAHGVIHRDVKPGNIMLGEATGLGDHVRIFDFGLAKLHDPDLHGEASVAAIVGTPAYMAPEQARADKVDGRADLYAAGVVLFEMLTGKKPFEADNAYQLLSLQRDKPAPRLRELAPELSPALEAVLGKALEKDPALRYQSAEEFGAALETAPEWSANALAPVQRELGLAKTQIAPGVPFSSRDVPDAPRSRRKTRAAFALLLLAAFGFAWWRFHLEPVGSGTNAHASELARPAALAKTKPAPASAPTALAHAQAAGTRVAAALLDVLSDRPSAEITAQDASDTTLTASAESGTERAASAGEEGEDLGELSEAALAAADEALNDGEEREVVLSAAVERAKRPVETIADVRALMRRGESEAAIRGIQQLRHKRPRDAQLPFLLGNLYFDKGWWLDGLAKYRETIQLASSYRKSPRIQRDAIRALGQDRAYPRARALLVRDMGKAALPALRRAQRADASGSVRRRASSIAKQIAR